MDSETQNKSTGPRTPEGKANSSMNSLKHGCRSEKTILRHEDPADYAALIQGWFTHYAPQDDVARHLVDETAHAHWFLKRTVKRLADIEYELPGSAHIMTDDQERRYYNFRRYKTADERSFFRWYEALERHYRLHQGRNESRENARAQASVIEAGLAPPAAPVPEVEQSLAVHTDGQTVFTPTNDELLAAASPNHPPLFVKRIIHFPQGPPPGLSWTNSRDLQPIAPGTLSHHLSWDKWLAAAAAERERFNNSEPYNLLLPSP